MLNILSIIVKKLFLLPERNKRTMERTELLNKLYPIRTLMNKIFNEKHILDNICSSYVSLDVEIGTKTLVDKGNIFMTGAIISYGLVLFMRRQWFFLLCLIAYMFARIDGKKEGCSYRILDIIFKIQGIYLIYSCFTKPQALPAYLLLFGVAGIICAIIIKIKNKSVRRYNKLAEKRNYELHKEYAMHREICELHQYELQGITEGWYPPNYLTLDCVEFFIEALENMRADNLKELVSLYEQTKHYQRIERQNATMVNLQRLSNIMQIFEMGENARHHARMERECSDMNIKLSSVNSELTSLNAKLSQR